MAICQAVQHAHQKGIVHRDLKPANILVTLIDGKPVPKVIDFGMAKATGRQAHRRVVLHPVRFGGRHARVHGARAGRLLGEDVDTRADIYSLGVILYELLTGLRPIDARLLRNAAITEMIRLIREEEPSKPSTRLSTDESLPSLAALRQTEPRRLMAMLRGEFDWVVMRCLERVASGGMRRPSGWRGHPAVPGGRAGGGAAAVGGVSLAEVPQATQGPGDPAAHPPRSPGRDRRDDLWPGPRRGPSEGGRGGPQGRGRAAGGGRGPARQAVAAERRRRRRTRQSRRAADGHRGRQGGRGRGEIGRVNDFLTQDLLAQAEPANNAVEDHVTLLEVVDRAAEKAGRRFAGHPQLEAAVP